MQRKTVFILFGAAVLVAAVVAVVVAQVAGGRLPGLASPTPDPTVTADPTPDEQAPDGQVPEDFTRFEDEEAGFAIAYPADWERLTSDDPNVRLIATPNGRDSILVRVVSLDAAIREEDLPAIRQYTDDLVEVENVELQAEPAQVEISGLPGIYYFYTFVDDESGEEGAHAHYFLFDGSTMFTVVLQALPAERFDPLAPLFDDVMDTFEPL